MTDYSRYYYSYSLLYRVPVFGVVHEDRGGGRIPPPNNDTVSTPMLTTTRTRKIPASSFLSVCLSFFLSFFLSVFLSVFVDQKINQNNC